MPDVQQSLDLGFAQNQVDEQGKVVLASGQVAWIGNYQVRNFGGYYQSREGGVGSWMFHIAGFDGTSTGQCGQCSVIRADGSSERVAIDALDRITVMGSKYGRDQWKH